MGRVNREDHMKDAEINVQPMEDHKSHLQLTKGLRRAGKRLKSAQAQIQTETSTRGVVVEG